MDSGGGRQRPEEEGGGEREGEEGRGRREMGEGALGKGEERRRNREVERGSSTSVSIAWWNASHYAMLQLLMKFKVARNSFLHL